MAFEVLKARLGIGGRRRRYIDIESVRDLDEISDPETTEDDSATGLRNWAGDHPVLSVIAGIVALLVSGIMLFYLSRFAPTVLGNIWLQRGAAALLIVGYGYKTGWSNHREKVAEWDELVLKMGDDGTSFRGTYVELPGKADGFIPIKGWRKAGHVPKPYKNADLGAAMVESFNSAKVEDDDPAVIRLQPGEVAMTRTDWGVKLVQRTSGLKPDEQGNHTSLKATLPEFDDSRANELASQLEQVTQDYYDVVEEAEGLRRRNKNLKDRLNDPIEEEVKNRMREVRRFTEAADGRTRRRQAEDGVGPRPQEDFRGTGTVSRQDAQSEIEDVEQELSADD